MLHGPQAGCFDLSFSLPSECADRVEAGKADIGLVPCAELRRLGLSYAPDVGIACRGPVRSILLLTRTDPASVRTLAADSSSRTSVQLARIVLERKYGGRPEIVSMRPSVCTMLESSDAALIIGDPALRIDPTTVPYRVLDLGAEWMELTGMPMVFAVWAGRPSAITPEARRVFVDSYAFGRECTDDIAAGAPRDHGVAADIAREYLTRHITYELGEAERHGLAQFLEWC
jgi:predicted solute-binding protein